MTEYKNARPSTTTFQDAHSQTVDTDKPLTTSNFSTHHNASAQRELGESWIKANPRPWAFCKEQARTFAAAGRHFSMQSLLERARWSGKVNYSDADPVFKVNNTTIPALSRLLDEELPEVAPWHEKRRSACDYEFGSASNG